MTWCNLYSTASKYNLCIKQSRYRNVLLLSSYIFFNVLLLSYVTYEYQLVLAIVVLTMAVISVFIAKKGSKQATILQLTLDEHGICSFEHVIENSVNSKDDIKNQFQLLASSRFSFFGCWLYMIPLSHMYSSECLSEAINKRRKQKRLFIYRDSLSSVDFSRLSQVISTLKNTY